MAHDLVPSPPTPVMLYLGAGYDLSPLLTFAPRPPLYPIVPLACPSHAPTTPPGGESYTSFLFVDAKPRHTSAYMVADWDEWTTVDARVRNVMRYAQGTLDRWRVVDRPVHRRKAPEQWAHAHTEDGGDLIWFEGGGDPRHIATRRADPAWHFWTAHSPPDPDAPLTTLLYAFNTLDVELAPNPYLAHVWPQVDALYVHGLHPHARTGLAGLVRLRRCYVIVGSWEAIRGVDFVRGEEWSDDEWEDEDRVPASPLVFNRHSIEEDEEDELLRWAEPVARAERVRALALAFGSSTPSLSFSSPSLSSADSFTPNSPPEADSPPPRPFLATFARSGTAPPPRGPPIHTQIPQIAWSDTLRGGLGGYYVDKTVRESLRLWRARGRRAEADETGCACDACVDGKDAKAVGLRRFVKMVMRGRGRGGTSRACADPRAVNPPSVRLRSSRSTLVGECMESETAISVSKESKRTRKQKDPERHMDMATFLRTPALVDQLARFPYGDSPRHSQGARRTHAQAHAHSPRKSTGDPRTPRKRDRDADSARKGRRCAEKGAKSGKARGVHTVAVAASSKPRGTRMAWIDWLVRGGDRVGMDSAGSDATRVG